MFNLGVISRRLFSENNIPLGSSGLSEPRVGMFDMHSNSRPSKQTLYVVHCCIHLIMYITVIFWPVSVQLCCPCHIPCTVCVHTFLANKSWFRCDDEFALCQRFANMLAFKAARPSARILLFAAVAATITLPKEVNFFFVFVFFQRSLIREMTDWHSLLK